MKLKHLGSLITHVDDKGVERALGYLINFKGHGIFAPSGRVKVTEEQMKAHNEALAKAELEGLDNRCKVGMYGTFYFVDGQIQTFTGVEVSTRVVKNGSVITFYRKGMVFRGREQKDAQLLNFRRVL